MAKKEEKPQLKHIKFKVKDIETIEIAAEKLGVNFSTFIRLSALEKAKRTK